jgi:hypothetical protein
MSAFHQHRTFRASARRMSATAHLRTFLRGYKMTGWSVIEIGVGDGGRPSSGQHSGLPLPSS